MELEEAIKRFNEIKEEYNRFDGLTEYVEAMDFILNHITKQEKMIELMLEYLNFYGVEDDICTAELSKDCNENCKECIKQYFEKKQRRIYNDISKYW